jgi:RNA polymerase sigma-70 factor (ECF subfamily)
LVFTTAAHSLDHSTAEEIVQDVFLAVWRNAAVFTPKRGAFRPWLLQIAHFRILNEHRRRRHRPRLQPDTDGLLLASLPDDGPGPEELAWRESLRPVMRSACRELPRSQRQAVDLAFFKDLSHQEVATELRIPLGTVKTRIRTGLRKLRGKLAPKVNDHTDFSSRHFDAKSWSVPAGRANPHAIVAGNSLAGSRTSRDHDAVAVYETGVLTAADAGWVPARETADA